MNQKNQSNNNQKTSKKAKKILLILVISGFLAIISLLVIIFFLLKTSYQNKQSPSQKEANKNQTISTSKKQDICSYNEESSVNFSKHNYEQTDDYNPSAKLKFEYFQQIIPQKIKVYWVENVKELRELVLGGKLD